MSRTPETCPNCGADLPKNAKVCPECGSDEKTGWSSDAHTGGLELPEEDDFNYDEFVEREFSEKKNLVPHGIHWFWWVVAIIVVLALLMPLIASFLRK